MSNDRLTVAAVAEEIGVSPSTVIRWIRKGVSINGRLIRLAAERVGGRRYVMGEMLEAFMSACNNADEPQEMGPEPVTPKRQRQHEREQAALAARLG